MPGVNYNMLRRNNDGTTVEIKSKKQYESFLKKNGLVSMSPKEMLSVKPLKDPYQQKRRKAVERVFERAQKDGIDKHKVAGFMKDVLQIGKEVRG